MLFRSYPTYSNEDSIESKISKVARHIYGAATITYSTAAKRKIKAATENGFSRFPICIAKTQYSFSTDPKAYGVAKDFEFHVRDIVINSGAEMVVVVAGDIMRMPGLPKAPQANIIDVADGKIIGLS